MAYKNVDVLARALHGLPGWSRHLISPMTQAERPHLEAIAPPGTLVCHDGASDVDYQRILRDATALVAPPGPKGSVSHWWRRWPPAPRSW